MVVIWPGHSCDRTVKCILIKYHHIHRFDACLYHTPLFLHLSLGNDVYDDIWCAVDWLVTVIIFDDIRVLLFNSIVILYQYLEGEHVQGPKNSRWVFTILSWKELYHRCSITTPKRKAYLSSYEQPQYRRQQRNIEFSSDDEGR